MHHVYWDIETRSGVNLRECGAHVYAIDPTTQPLCLAYAVDDGEPQLVVADRSDAARCSSTIAANPDDWRLVAHNWEFERAILEHVLIPRYGFLPIPLEIQHCTQRLALANAYPAELGLLARGARPAVSKRSRSAQGDVGRCRVRRRSASASPPPFRHGTKIPAKLQLIYERCQLDVVTTRAVFTSPKLKPLIEPERRYLLLDAAINARGVRLDRQFTAAAMDLAVRERTAIGLKLQEISFGAITSVNQVTRFWRRSTRAATR